MRTLSRWLQRLRPRALRTRLVAAAAISILAAVVVFAIVTVALVNHQLRSSLDAALRERAQEVAQLAVSAPTVLSNPGALESPISGRQISVQVIDARERIVARSLNLGAELLPIAGLARAAVAHGRTGAVSIEFNGRPTRLYAAPIADAGGPASGGAVLVASDTSDIARTTGKLGALVALSGAAVVLVAMLAAALLTRRSLRPLSALADAAAGIERTADPARRLPATAAPDEIGRLTGVLNRMLAALEEAQAGERRFLADASHELRTPVASLLGNVEYASRHGADAEVLADLRHDAERLARLVDSLLALERAGAAPPAGEAVALDALAAAVVEEQASGRVRLERADAVAVRGDPAALRRAVGNLIENGLVHGPVDGPVAVSVVRGGDGRAWVSVTDAGPGPDPAERDRLFERFWRGPEAAGRPGSGLGLSIVAAIAGQHGGSVRVDGSTFTLELPVDGEPGPRAQPGDRAGGPTSPGGASPA